MGTWGLFYESRKVLCLALLLRILYFRKCKGGALLMRSFFCSFLLGEGGKGDFGVEGEGGPGGGFVSLTSLRVRES